MGWRSFSQALDENVVPQKDDSPSTMIQKAVFAPFGAAISLLDLFNSEPSGGGSSSGSHGSGSSGSSGGGGCHCDCDDHR